MSPEEIKKLRVQQDASLNGFLRRLLTAYALGRSPGEKIERMIEVRNDVKKELEVVKDSYDKSERGRMAVGLGLAVAKSVGIAVFCAVSAVSPLLLLAVPPAAAAVFAAVAFDWKGKRFFKQFGGYSKGLVAIGEVATMRITEVVEKNVDALKTRSDLFLKYPDISAIFSKAVAKRVINQGISPRPPGFNL